MYVGVHKTNNLDDGYLGSGILLRKALLKYGSDAFTREILKHCSSEEEMYATEANIVTEQIVKDDNFYNVSLGGEWHGSERQQANNQRSQAVQAQLRKNPQWVKRRADRISEGSKRAYQNGSRVSKIQPHIPGEFHHTDETKKLLSDSKKGTKLQAENSQYKSRWMRHDDLKVNRKVRANEDVQQYLDNGWVFGRKMNYTKQWNSGRGGPIAPA